MLTRLTCSVLLRVKVLGAELGLKLNVLFRSREEDLVLFQCCRLNPNFRLERSGADIQTSSQEISFQLCIPIWLEGFSAVYFMMMIFFFFFALPLLAAVICLKSPFSDQFPRLNLWGARRLYVRLERGVKLFSRQCDGVSRRCFSAKQKINIYWQDSEGFFFSFCLFVWSHLCPFCLQGHETHGLFFWFQSGERRFIQPPSCCFFLDYLPVGARLWATNPHGR